jgi:hypothetical protein
MENIKFKGGETREIWKKYRFVMGWTFVFFINYFNAGEI